MEWCNDCKYEEACKNEFPACPNGKDHTAMTGTHFCRRSWDSFFQADKEQEIENSDSS